MSSSTSSSESEVAWRAFVRRGALAFVASLIGAYAFVLIVDPYQTVPFSPAWQRHPLSNSARVFNAALARVRSFDSAVVGNSAIMLLKPDALDAGLGGRFVNLAMPAASPFEMHAMLEHFRRHHQDVRTIILGFDVGACHLEGHPPFIANRGDEYPYALFDADDSNDWPGLSGRTLADAWYQFRALLGFPRSPRDARGYHDFTQGLYSRANSPEDDRRRIYETRPALLFGPADPGPLAFPDVDRVVERMAMFPDATRLIFLIPPAHFHHQPKPGTISSRLWELCKAKLVREARRLSNVWIVDFSRPSRITRADGNYIDGIHYYPPIADEIARTLAVVVDGSARPDETYAVLAQPSEVESHKQKTQGR
ncbi:MAG: hypothetical protein KDG50_05620 [Chromatiales bacterium]|nr:hypothetical protein [Chromatiales bacterium]